MLRAWQIEALNRWIAGGRRGIVEVVTGGGKTRFALACIERARASTSLVVVPTVALLDQWWEETAAYFNLPLDEIHLITGQKRMRSGTVNLAVLNTAAKLHEQKRSLPCLLVVDECHKAASPLFRSVFDIPTTASLGLSATPERPYDDGLADILVPALGKVLFQYTYRDALRDHVIVPFELRNVVFDLDPESQHEYDRLTRAIGRATSQYGPDDERTIGLYLRRTRVLNLSINRIRLSLTIIAGHRGRRVLVFHEDIAACDLLHSALESVKVRSGVYHSQLPLRKRTEMLRAYRQGELDVLVTCRALDEGFNVPETEVGVIAASTATRRQRIQRLGRVLRPSSEKTNAIVYTLVASHAEISRLREEESELEGVARVGWSRA